MTCSLQIYRVRIGTFSPSSVRKSCRTRAPRSSVSRIPLGLLVLVIFYSSMIMIVDLENSLAENDDKMMTSKKEDFQTRAECIVISLKNWDKATAKLNVVDNI